MIPTRLRDAVVCYGEILWDILPDKSLPGGAPMNVAYHLKKLGANPALITRVGKDEHGSKLVDLLSASGLTTGYVQSDEIYQTGLVYARLGEHNEVTYDIVQPVAWDFIQWRESFTDLLSEADYLVYGSLTSRSRQSRETLYQLLDVARTRVLDINLRPPHFTRPHIEYLLQKADILKMNAAELALITGWFSPDLPQEDGMRLLQDRFNISTIVVTLGGEGAMMLRKGVIDRHDGYRVQVADTIGSGDAFLAGLLSQLIGGAESSDALNFASALGALIATYSGACPAYDLSEVGKLMFAGEPQKDKTQTIL